MRTGTVLFAIVGLCLSLLCCATPETTDNPEPVLDIPFIVADDFGEGIEIHGVSAQKTRNQVEFRFEYTSDVQRGMSFFDPPAGDTISIQQTLPAGNQSVTIRTSAAKLRTVQNITVNFYIPAVELTGRIYLDSPAVAELTRGSVGTSETPVSNSSSIYSRYPLAGQQEVYIDQDIHIASRPPFVFDLPSANAAFSISPEVPYTMYARWFLGQADSELTVELDDLQANTTYTVTFTEELNLGNAQIPDAWEWNFTTGPAREFELPSGLGRPEFTMTENAPESLSFELTWTAVPGATEYEIHQSVSEAYVGYEKLGSTAATSFEVTVDQRNQYYYRVRATAPPSYGQWSQIFYIEPSP